MNVLLPISHFRSTVVVTTAAWMLGEDRSSPELESGMVRQSKRGNKQRN